MDFWVGQEWRVEDFVGSGRREEQGEGVCFYEDLMNHVVVRCMSTVFCLFRSYSVGISRLGWVIMIPYIDGGGVWMYRGRNH